MHTEMDMDLVQHDTLSDEDAALELFAEELPTISDSCQTGCCWSTASTSLSCLVSSASTCCT